MQHLDRRMFLAAIPVALVACSAGAPQRAQSETPDAAGTTTLPQMIVHKSPTCGCCTAWVDHLRADGFDVSVIETDDLTPVAQRLGVPDALRGCHTAEIGGYAIEGHVPATDIRRLLAERPDAAGLAVPGMPMGSPGMNMSDRQERYDVILFDRANATRTFASY